MTGSGWLRAALLGLLACGSSPSAAGENAQALEIGISPFLPVKTLVQNYAPLSQHLHKQLGMPVSLISAPDYLTFYQRIASRDFPIIITAANSAYVAWADNHYIPLLQPLNPTRPCLVVRAGQKLNHLQELRDTTIAMSDATAIVSIQGMQWLRESDLTPGHDITVRHMANHRVAVNHVLTGEVVAAIVSDHAILQLPKSMQEQFDVALSWDKGAAPGIVYLGSPDLPREQLEKIRLSILEFANNTEAGRKQMQDFGYGGLKPVSLEEMQSLQPYGLKLQEALRQ